MNPLKSLPLIILLATNLRQCPSLTPSLSTDKINDAIIKIDETIAKLEYQGDAWREHLQSLSDKVYQAIRSDIENLSRRMIAAAGVETRCNADFLTQRIKMHLERIKVKLLGQTLPGVKPVICLPTPNRIDLSLPTPEKIITYAGYDFDDARDKIKVFIENENGRTQRLRNVLNVQSHYEMSLNLDRYNFTTASKSVKLFL